MRRYAGVGRQRRRLFNPSGHGSLPSVPASYSRVSRSASLGACRLPQAGAAQIRAGPQPCRRPERHWLGMDSTGRSGQPLHGDGENRRRGRLYHLHRPDPQAPDRHLLRRQRRQRRRAYRLVSRSQQSPGGIGWRAAASCRGARGYSGPETAVPSGSTLHSSAAVERLAGSPLSFPRDRARACTRQESAS